MGEFSIWHWAIVLLYILGFGVPLWKIATKAGFSGWWSLLAHIPLLNLVVLWLFVLAKWPARKD